MGNECGIKEIITWSLVWRRQRERPRNRLKIKEKFN